MHWYDTYNTIWCTECQWVQMWQWKEKWPARLTQIPYLLENPDVGVYGKSAPRDFMAQYVECHLHEISLWRVSKICCSQFTCYYCYLHLTPSFVFIDSRFVAALKDSNFWIMNEVTVDSPNTLITYKLLIGWSIWSKICS